MNTLLLEIGTEEIPAGYIVPALESMSATLSKKLADARIEHGRLQIYGTPRRLAVTIEDVAAKQRSVKSEVPALRPISDLMTMANQLWPARNLLRRSVSP